MNKDAISALIRVFACLVLVFAIGVFPPSATHAGSSKDSGLHVHSADVSASAAHQASHGKTVQSGGFTECGSDFNAAHSESGSNQCCSGICLTAVLIEVPSLRHDQVSSSQYIAGFSQMTPVDPNGFLRPPRQLI